jgi:1-deoxy-D-xylulose-5-phosphate reductoisomerase
VILNAANEVAVEAFLGGRLSFPGIHAVNLGVMDALEGRHEALRSLDDLLELDARTRREASQWVAREGAR